MPSSWSYFSMKGRALPFRPYFRRSTTSSNDITSAPSLCETLMIRALSLGLLRFEPSAMLLPTETADLRSWAVTPNRSSGGKSALSRYISTHSSCARFHTRSFRKSCIFASSHVESRLKDRRPTTDNGQPTTVNRQPSTVNRQPQTVNRELRTAHCEPRTANRELRTANCEPPTHSQPRNCSASA